MHGQLPSCCAGRWRALCRGGYRPAGCCRRCCCPLGCQWTLSVCATHRCSAACPQASGPVRRHSTQPATMSLCQCCGQRTGSQSELPVVASISVFLVTCGYHTANDQMLAAQGGECPQEAVLLLQGSCCAALPRTCSEWVREASEALWLCRPRMVGSAGAAARPPDIRASTSRACACGEGMAMIQSAIGQCALGTPPDPLLLKCPDHAPPFAIVIRKAKHGWQQGVPAPPAASCPG
jgi:hypothetical protein